ncbi:hypothetical protein HME9304_02924 [Flagellimonas maritima]|uniref:Tetratricopeptide repeat protein n=1 Tax=Flagellimonas maritima TaxID=1383885 RepID=A0A2Z4LW43_9FLAO|nr:DUF6340 family protein [Allomuricauda aurantiaca]AWX45893.1 hypothetical protein HME9304_02924 [Allomuricauda aurantiaca]
MKLFAHIFLIFIFTYTLISCSATNKLTLGVTEPAILSLPSDVGTIGIINRSLASEKNNVIDKLDKILSLEGLNLDREGALAAITGLYTELERNSQFETIKIIDSIDVIRKGLSVFPAQLSWELVEQICNENNVDVLFSLEFYDTDTRADYQATIVNIPNNFGINAKVPGHRVTLQTMIKNGWRVYNPINKQILDEFISKDQIVSTGEGINPVKAIEAVMARKEAVIQLSNQLGNNYGLNLRQMRRRVARDYFVRGTDNFVIAKRRAQTGDWDGAAALWNTEVEHPKRKIAGRAHYNMAIINEINGNLEKAIDWASKSYSDFGIREGLRYINILRRRVADHQEIERQLSK